MFLILCWFLYFNLEFQQLSLPLTLDNMICPKISKKKDCLKSLENFFLGELLKELSDPKILFEKFKKILFGRALKRTV